MKYMTAINSTRIYCPPQTNRMIYSNVFYLVCDLYFLFVSLYTEEEIRNNRNVYISLF
jgi:hypothetical protein